MSGGLRSTAIMAAILDIVAFAVIRRGSGRLEGVKS
jgi:hypothetical protein